MDPTVLIMDHTVLVMDPLALATVMDLVVAATSPTALDMVNSIQTSLGEAATEHLMTQDLDGMSGFYHIQ